MSAPDWLAQRQQDQQMWKDLQEKSKYKDDFSLHSNFHYRECKNKTEQEWGFPKN